MKIPGVNSFVAAMTALLVSYLTAILLRLSPATTRWRTYLALGPNGVPISGPEVGGAGVSVGLGIGVGVEVEVGVRVAVGMGVALGAVWVENWAVSDKESNIASWVAVPAWGLFIRIEDRRRMEINAPPKITMIAVMISAMIRFHPKDAKIS
jgi:hypothetical protein